MQHFHDILNVTVRSTGTFGAMDLIGYDGAAVTAADAPVLGVALSPNTVAGDYAAVMTIGWVRVRAASIVTAGAKLVSAAAGGVQVAGADPDNAFATALTSAAAGEFVDILIR